MRWVLAAALCIAPVAASADDPRVDHVVEAVILPDYAAFADQADALSAAAATDCQPTEALKAAYHDAFDAWIAVAHFQFGPAEAEDRAFALAFWPDPRGSTPKALAALIAAEDPVVDDPTAFATVSVAARGFFGLDQLMFDDRFAGYAADSYGCRLTQAVTRDIAGAAAALRDAWAGGYAASMTRPDPVGAYRSEADALRALYTALTTGVQFNADVRLGRPLGTFQRPRPRRAEAWRSERSLRNVIGSVAALRRLAAALDDDRSAAAADAVDAAFAQALEHAARIDDPAFAGVATPTRRIAIEALQQRVAAIRVVLAERLGPALGVREGFNSLDGD